MSPRKAIGLLMIAGLAGLAGCSRTYDGTVVPTYQMNVGSFAGLPTLTMTRTPLEEPSVAMDRDAALSVFPPVPPAPVATGEPQPTRSVAARSGSQRRTAVARPRTGQAAPVAPALEEPKTLLCENRPSADRAVSMVCE